ncbi:MotE family protein [Sulfitobacter sp. M368]|uniref:MotE family protein n=1 Tax=Sulfitobacter sp. M368 TaxID=2867021 RepID=UPI0021A86C86|nr:hypothetical protein K3754_18615 [Sulfitobacter sp. M368]
MKLFKKRKALRKKGGGTVGLIALLLVGSAALRAGSEAGSAYAEATKDQIRETAETPKDPTSKMPGQQTMDRSEMSNLLTALLKREMRVKEQEKKIEMRSKALAVADEEITKRLAALEQAENALRETLSLADGAAEGDLARLTAVYESMKPKDAAALFGAMEPDFAAGFLGRMRPDAAASVMAGLPADMAYAISVILAGRNTKVPKS